jgi:hypothetical protein
VTLSNPIRASLCKISFVAIGLAISVFAWGLQYKLSLYFPAHSAYHQVPKAKLLSKNEQPNRVEELLVSSTKPGSEATPGFSHALTLFAWVLALPAFTRRRQARQDREKPWLAALSAGLGAFFFRPPPRNA